MKYLLSTILFITLSIGLAQDPIITKDVEFLEPFHSVNVNAHYNVYVKQSNEIKIEARALKEVLDVTTFTVKDGILSIDVKRDKKDKSIWEQIDDIKIAPKLELYISMKEVRALNLNGHGRLITKNSIASENLQLSLSGNGTMEVDIKGGQLAINLSGGGLMMLSGYADKGDLNVSGYGKIEAYPLDFTDLNATLSGPGNAEVTASDNLIATVNGEGNLLFKGNTKQVTKRENGSGEIKRTY